MGLHFAEVTKEYAKNKELKKEDVEGLIAWANEQPHLPKITELQAILFLHSCYYRFDEAKAAIDAHFTMRTLSPALFRGQLIKITIDRSFGDVLPKKTPEGYTIIFGKLLYSCTGIFDVIDQMKYFVLGAMLDLYQEGTSEGHIVVIDMENVLLGHFVRATMAGPALLEKFISYLQEAMPLRLKGLHFFNTVHFMDKLIALVKPYLKPEILDMVHLHNSVEDLVQFVPLECLPQDYKGGVEPISALHEKVKRRFSESSEFFKWDEQQVIDESKREKKLQSLEIVGETERSFKKLNVD